MANTITFEMTENQAKNLENIIDKTFMWEKIYDIFAKVFSLTGTADRQESDRENILTLVENQLLKFERRLPSGKDSEKDNEK
jgi:hypothetical protein